MNSLGVTADKSPVISRTRVSQAHQPTPIRWTVVLLGVLVVVATVMIPVYWIASAHDDWSLAKHVSVGGGIVALAAGLLAAFVGSSDSRKWPSLREACSLSLALIGILGGLLALVAGLSAPNS